MFKKIAPFVVVVAVLWGMVEWSMHSAFARVGRAVQGARVRW